MAQAIFVDSWAWIAVTNINDSHHQVAKHAYDYFYEQRYRFITSNFVLAETYTLLRRRAPVHITIAFGRKMQQYAEQKLLTVVQITPEIEREAWHLFEMYESVNGLSYTDCTSFAAIKARGLRQAFTNDEHFAMAGFELYAHS